MLTEEQVKQRKKNQEYRAAARKVQRHDAVTNKKFAHDDVAFKEACSAAGVEPTVRQASKYRNKQGAAYKTKKGLL